MVSKKQLQNLARGRAIRQRNLQMQRRPQRVRQRRIVVPRGKTLLNPRTFVNPDLDVSKLDVGGVNEKISAEGETLFAGLDDMIPRAIQGLRRRRR